MFKNWVFSGELRHICRTPNFNKRVNLPKAFLKSFLCDIKTFCEWVTENKENRKKEKTLDQTCRQPRGKKKSCLFPQKNIFFPKGKPPFSKCQSEKKEKLIVFLPHSSRLCPPLQKAPPAGFYFFFREGHTHTFPFSLFFLAVSPHLAFHILPYKVSSFATHYCKGKEWKSSLL